MSKKNEKYYLKADIKKMMAAGREETLEMLKEKFRKIERKPSNEAWFHVAKILNIIEMEKDSKDHE